MISSSVHLAKLPLFITTAEKDVLADCLLSLDKSLQSKHPAMSTAINPLLEKLKTNNLTSDAAKNALIQYCFLPKQIVILLKIAQRKLESWSFVDAELERNINEELGSRTDGISHYQILRNGLLNELGLDLSQTQMSQSTEVFLDSLTGSLLASRPSYVLGNIYALENSAVPELSVVAEIINGYASLCNKPPLIQAPEISSRKEKYHNLDSFFAMHLADFEIGHKVGLVSAIRKQSRQSSINLDEFQFGFEYVLDQMDLWWEALAKSS